jgi:cell division septation protein DedD
MRWIFFSLIAANLGILGWWQTNKTQPHNTVHTYTTPTGVGSIVLLSEVKESAVPETVAPAIDEPAVAPATEVVPAPPAAEPPAPSAPAAANGVGEQPSAAAPVANTTEALTQCVLVGPFDNNQLAQQALQKLQTKEINAHLYQMELSISSGFQVFLDGFENRAQAKKRLDELQAIGVDSFIVPKGEYINTIALGSFDQESAAKTQLENFAAKGISAKVRESKRPVMELWVALPPETGDTLPDPLRQALGVGKGDKKKEERQILCSTIASSKNIL